MKSNIAFKNSLGFKLLIWLLSISLIPLIIISYLGYTTSSSSLKNDAVANLKQSSFYHKKFIENWFNYRKIDVSTWSQNREFTKLLMDLENGHDDENIRSHVDYVKSFEYIEILGDRGANLVNLSREYDYIYDVFLIDMDGDILYSVEKEDDLGTSLVNGPYSDTKFANAFRETLKDGKVHFSDLEKYAPSNQTIAGFITAPLVDDKGDLVGIFAVQIKPDRVYKIFSSESGSKYGHYIIGEDALLRTDYRDKKGLEYRVDSGLYSSWKSKVKEDELLSYKNLFGHESIGIYQTIDIYGVNWILVSEVTKKDLYASIYETLMEQFLLLIAVIGVVILVSIYISKKLFKPLVVLSDASREISSGTRDIKIDIDTKDELGNLADSFNHMVKSLKINEERLNEQTKEAHKALQELDEQRFALDAHSIVAITDVEGNITFVNEKFVEISGYSEEELIGQNHRLVNSGYHDREFWKNMYKKLLSGKVWSAEVCNMRKDGEIYWVNTTVIPFMNDDGTPRSYIAIRTDITEQKLIEEELIKANELAEETLKAKSEFLASMSHEIRTPMNGVIGMLGLLLKSDLDDTQRHQAALAKNSATALLSLINDILDFSKVEAGKMDLEHIDFNIRDEFGDFAESMALKSQEKGVELILDVTEIERDFINADPGRIRQILSNIVGNSVKFTKEGYIYIKASLKIIDSIKARLVIEMSDTGIGIPEDKLGSLFDSFSQVDSSTTRKYGGTGLGLAIVKKLCALMDGDVRVESELGKGSKFTVDIAVDLSKESSLVIPKVSVEGKKILIVDDCKLSIEAIGGQLKHWGMEVKSTFFADEVMDMLEDETFDILFLDMYMPDMNGEELAAKIRQESRFKDIKIVMMTSLENRGDVLNYERTGIDAFFPKPATTNDLFSALSVLDGKFNKITPLKHLEEIENIVWNRDIKILLVEDNHTNQMVANGILEGFSLSADVADNGIEALKILSDGKKDYDIILMDCQMPEMDGYETTRAIRGNRAGSRYRDIPIIAMTANAMQGDREKCEIAGMDDYISKPINPDNLKSVLKKWLSHEEQVVDSSSDDEIVEKELVEWSEDDALARLGGSQKLLLKVIDVFLADIYGELKELYGAIGSDNRKKIELHAHSIKGSAGNLSAFKVQELAKSIEFSSQTKDIEALHDDYEVLAKDIDEVVILLEEFVNRHKSNNLDKKSITKEELITSLRSLHVELSQGGFIDSDTLDIFVLSYSEDIDKKMQELKQEVDNFDTDKALALIDDIITKVG